jgi:hypothetical protein
VSLFRTDLVKHLDFGAHLVFFTRVQISRLFCPSAASRMTKIFGTLHKAPSCILYQYNCMNIIKLLPRRKKTSEWDHFGYFGSYNCTNSVFNCIVLQLYDTIRNRILSKLEVTIVSVLLILYVAFYDQADFKKIILLHCIHNCIIN